MCCAKTYLRAIAGLAPRQEVKDGIVSPQRPAAPTRIADPTIAGVSERMYDAGHAVAYDRGDQSY
jgi:hypothetical protein